MSEIEAFTKAENDLLSYLFWKYRNGCYVKMDIEPQDSIGYRGSERDLRLLSEIERKLEVHT